MKFKVDENLPVEICDLLKNAGHESMTVLEQKMGGKPDEDLFKICRREGRAIVTLDFDFSDIRRYPPWESAGIILLCTPNQSKKNAIELAKKIIPALASEPLKGQLWIVGATRIRIREASD